MKSYQKKKDEVINGLSDKAKEYGFGVKQNPAGGIYFLPLVDGKMINEDDFEDLDDETREKFLLVLRKFKNLLPVQCVALKLLTAMQK